MLRWIVGTSLQFRFLVIVLAAALMAFGFAQLRAMPVDVLPEFSPPYVEIQTEALGLSAEDVEQLITVPMEQDLLNGVAWLDVIRSESVPGLSSILLFFEPGTDLFRARQMVQERLAQAYALPHVSKPPTMIQPLSSTSRFLIIGLASKDLSLIEMSVLARWTIGPSLMGVPGVANVAIWGQRERQLQVQVDPERLRAQGVSLEQVVETTGNALWVSSLSFLEASTPGTGGFIDTPNQRLGIWHVLPISSPDDLAQVPVGDTTGLRLSDVARVVEDHQPLIGDAIIDDGPNLLLVVEKFPGANTLEVTQGVEAELEALRPGLTGIEVDATVFRPATFIEIAIGNLTNALIIGALLAALVLGALFFEWRVALVSLVAIPTSLIAALLVLYLRGATLNVMILAGLVVALSAIIDDAIVDVENIARRLRQPPPAEGGQPRAAVAIILEAALEMRSSLFFAVLISVLAALPIFFIEGVSGAFFQPLASAYALAVLTSMAVALTVTPALSLILLSSMPRQRREPPLLAWLQRGYDRALAGSLRTPRLVFGAVAAVIVVGLLVLPLLRQEQLLPTFQEPNLMIRWEGTPGTSRPEMARIVARASRELRSIPGVLNVGAHVGRAVFGDQVVGVNSSMLWIGVDPEANYAATLAQIRAAVDSYPGLTLEVETYLQRTLRQALTRADTGIVVRVFGENPGILRRKADEVRQALTAIVGVADLRVALPVEEPTLEIQVDLTAAQRYGIKPGDVRRAAATLLSGLQVGSLFEDQKVFDVVVWSTPETRQSVTDVRELLIDTPGGGHVRLEEVADVRVASTPSVIRREGVSPYLDITFNVQGRDLGAVAQDVEQALQRIEFPLEYHAEVLGEYAERQAAQQRLLLAGAVTAVGVFLLLHAASGNWRLAGLTLATLPAALVGGVLAGYLVNGGALSLGALIGGVPVLVIALRNGIALVSHYQHLEQHEGETFGLELIRRGARERLAPVLMTTLTTGLALSPLAVAGNVAGAELLHPMAIVLLGGLVTSLGLNLFVVPALYLRVGFNPEPDPAGQPVTPLAEPSASSD